MDEAIIVHWNDTVKPEDEIYNLGDVSFYKDFNETLKTLKRLNGKHHLILGNYDKHLRHNARMLLYNKFKDDGNRLFDSIDEVC